MITSIWIQPTINSCSLYDGWGFATPHNLNLPTSTVESRFSLYQVLSCLASTYSATIVLQWRLQCLNIVKAVRDSNPHRYVTNYATNLTICIYMRCLSSCHGRPLSIPFLLVPTDSAPYLQRHYFGCAIVVLRAACNYLKLFRLCRSSSSSSGSLASSSISPGSTRSLFFLLILIFVLIGIYIFITSGL